MTILMRNLSLYIMQVKLLGHIRHPHILAMIGFCTELKCVVFEYMQHGCLRDRLFSNPRSHKGRKLSLSWHARIRIAAEVCIGLSFLHKAKPRPIVHGNLNPSKVLLDRNNVAKIYGFKPGWNDDESDVISDIRAFGSLLLQLLMGRNWARLGEEAILMDSTMLVESLDKMAGEWPLDLAVELGAIAKSCLSRGENQEKEFSSKLLMRWIEKVRRKADELVLNADFAVAGEVDESTEDLGRVPKVFFCPIYQVAANQFPPRLCPFVLNSSKALTVREKCKFYT
jgi:serine/threonine protein kinase